MKDEVERSLLEDALKFANKGQQDLVPYDPSDIDEDNEYEESDKLLEEPEEDNMEILETFFLKTANHSNRYSQLKVWAAFLKKIAISAPDLSKVIELMLIVPNGTSEVERFFKILKSMKSKKRNNI